MKIQVFGKGCAKCEKLTKNIEEALKIAEITAEIEKVTEVDKITDFGVWATPAFAINGKLIVQGRVLPPKKIVEHLKSKG